MCNYQTKELPYVNCYSPQTLPISPIAALYVRIPTAYTLEKKISLKKKN